MKHSLAIKFLVFVLTVLLLGAAISCMAGIRILEEEGLYVNTLDNLQERQYDSNAKTIAEGFVKLYLAREYGLKYSDEMDSELWDHLYKSSDPELRADKDYWCVVLHLDENTTVTEGEKYTSASNAAFIGTYYVEETYAVYRQPKAEEENKEEPEEPEEPETPFGVYDKPGNANIPSLSGMGIKNYDFDWYKAPEYKVDVYLQERVLESSRLHLLTDLYPYRHHCVAIVVIGLLLSAAGLVYLLWAAGRTSDGKAQPGGINLIPLDIYALLTIVGVFLQIQLFEEAYIWVNSFGPHIGNLTILFVMLLGILLLPVGFLMALSAQIKVGQFYWWNHTALGALVRYLWKLLSILSRGLKHCFVLMPVIWQWVTAYGVMACLMILSIWAAVYSWWGVVLLILAILLTVSLVLYSGYALGTLLRGVRKMSNGEFSHKIPTEHLHGGFRECAVEMNALSETTMQAVQNQVRAERMKTELITNVSHDIKTPLTSIINFVDLMGKPHSAEADKQYLEVLSRQSNQLKKLIEDLLELSKASSGNLQANIITMDAAEAVNQALGEFSDKLEKADLIPVFHQPEEPILIAADGRMIWRVLSNLLNNAVKYATPGTRVYLELEQMEDTVQLSIKNVSKEELRLSAEDLLERFVRGDASRNREGSGLGLNIAKSLMEVQQGSLQLTLDGDLFKVTLTFPAANP